MILYIMNFIILSLIFQRNEKIYFQIFSSLLMIFPIYIGNKFNIVGITGGIGCGKSELTNLIKNKYFK